MAVFPASPLELVSTRLSTLVLLLLLAISFTLATSIRPPAIGGTESDQSEGLVQALLGEGRRLFANQFYVQADVYFHSGYYPSIFDQAKRAEASPMTPAGAAAHEAEQDHDAKGHDEHGGEPDEHHEEGMDFLQAPRDWIEKFGRHFMIADHTHLAGAQIREILPWLKMSAAMNPQRVETYTVASYWLRKNLGKPEEALQFLREGVRANPGNYEILLEMGRLFHENLHDNVRARNVLERAFESWTKSEAGKEKPDELSYLEITGALATIESESGNVTKAIAWLEFVKKYTPNPDAIQQRIGELRAGTNNPAGRR